MAKKQDQKKFQLTVRGSRGSYPVCAKEFIKYGGNTTCYEIKAGDNQVILDAGTGIINLGKELRSKQDKDNKPIVATILISHTHHDHSEGFPFFEPLYFGSSQLYLFGPSTSYVDIEDALTEGLAAPFFPVSLNDTNSLKKISPISEAEKIEFYARDAVPNLLNLYHDKSPKKANTTIRVLYGLNHPKNGVLHYRIEYAGKAIIYATDTEGYAGGDRRLIAFAKGADLLIHDAQYLPCEYLGGKLSKQGWGHSTFEMACEVAKEAGVKKLLLHHNDPGRTDEEVQAIENKAKKIFRNTEAAREGAVYQI